MKRNSALLIGLAILMVVAMVAFTVGQDKAAPSKGKTVTMTGKVTCTMCTLAHPETPCDKSCCQTCIKAGDPALFTDMRGNQYVLLSSDMKSPAISAERMEMAGDRVKVKGLLIKGKGVQAIVVDSMEKAAAKPKAATEKTETKP